MDLVRIGDDVGRIGDDVVRLQAEQGILVRRSTASEKNIAALRTQLTSLQSSSRNNSAEQPVSAQAIAALKAELVAKQAQEIAALKAEFQKQYEALKVELGSRQAEINAAFKAETAFLKNKKKRKRSRLDEAIPRKKSLRGHRISAQRVKVGNRSFSASSSSSSQTTKFNQAKEILREINDPDAPLKRRTVLIKAQQGLGLIQDLHEETHILILRALFYNKLVSKIVKKSDIKVLEQGLEELKKVKNSEAKGELLIEIAILKGELCQKLSKAHGNQKMQRIKYAELGLKAIKNLESSETVGILRGKLYLAISIGNLGKFSEAKKAAELGLQAIQEFNAPKILEAWLHRRLAYAEKEKDKKVEAAHRGLNALKSAPSKHHKYKVLKDAMEKIISNYSSSISHRDNPDPNGVGGLNSLEDNFSLASPIRAAAAAASRRIRDQVVTSDDEPFEVKSKARAVNPSLSSSSSASSSKKTTQGGQDLFSSDSDDDMPLLLLKSGERSTSPKGKRSLEQAKRASLSASASNASEPAPKRTKPNPSAAAPATSSSRAPLKDDQAVERSAPSAKNVAPMDTGNDDQSKQPASPADNGAEILDRLMKGWGNVGPNPFMRNQKN